MKEPSKSRQARNREQASLEKRIAELERAASQYGQMEERLRGSEQRLHGIIKNAQSGYFFIDRDGIFREVNDAWLRMHNYHSPDEIIGRHYSVTQVDADLGMAQRVVDGLLAGEPVPTGEFSRLCRDGSIGYHTFSAVPVFFNHEVIGLEGFLTDTTEHKKTLDALRVSEGRFRSIFENSLDAILLGLPAGEIVAANRAAQSLLGMTESEIRCAGRAGTVVQDEALARAREERETTGKWRGILTFRRKEGSTFPVEASSTAFDSPDGRVMTTLIFRDITDRKQAEDELRICSEILTRMADGVVLIRAKDGVIVYTNPRFESMFGYGSGELIGRHVSALNAPRGGSPEEVARKIMDVLEKTGEWKGEIYNLKKDGTLFWCHAHVSTFDHSVHGPVWISNQEDITERKEVERALHDSEERFRLFMDNSPTIAWIKDEQGRYVYLSKTYEDRFGVRATDWIGKTDAAFWPPEIAENFRMNDLAVLAGGHPIEITEQTINPDGNRGEWLISKFPFRAAGNLYIAGIGLDITERKKAEEELAGYRERLEELVRERTRELEGKTLILEELNAATRALLRQREEDRKELEERFVANMKNLILPYAEKMKKTRLDERQMSYLGIMEIHFKEIMSPLMRTMQQRNFTPAESQVASLIKDGKTTKEIAEIMGSATSSVDTHRKSIRKKLGLSKTKVNLPSHLRSMGI